MNPITILAYTNAIDIYGNIDLRKAHEYAAMDWYAKANQFKKNGRVMQGYTAAFKRCVKIADYHAKKAHP